MSATLRAWRWHRAGLDGSLRDRSLADVLDRTGWARSVAGAGPYLTLFSRTGASREAIDAAVARTEIHELPAARGCTYVLPAQDFALGLTVGQSFGEAELRTAAKLGVTDAEVRRLCDAVVAALGDSPLEPDAIRAATGDASRGLGEAGKKRGLTTTLPLALGRLQARGAIRRAPVNGRLDQQRYGYVRWSGGPSIVPATPDDWTTLARHFFHWHGPATVGEFAWFAGLGVKASTAAVEPLGLVSVEGECGGLALLPGDVDAFAAFVSRPARREGTEQPQYALVSSLDPILANRREIASLLEPGDADHLVYTDGGKRPLGGLVDLPSHAILERGRLVGLWEFDQPAGRIVAATFDGRRDRALDAAIASTEAFVRDQLGDARSFSLDSPKSRQPRVDALRQMA